jgi:hypothetical protein
MQRRACSVQLTSFAALGEEDRSHPSEKIDRRAGPHSEHSFVCVEVALSRPISYRGPVDFCSWRAPRCKEPRAARR